eukprot:tig00020934_g16072.t1
MSKSAVILQQDALSGEDVAAGVKELWADLGRLVGAGSPQGKKCWYRPARLLAALAESGHVAEMRAVLEAMGGAAVVVAQPKLAAALSAALVSAVEVVGGDSEAARAAVDVIGALEEAAIVAVAAAAKKASKEAASASAAFAARALASLAASEGGGAAAEAAAQRLGELARRDDKAAREAVEAAASLLGATISDLVAPGFRPNRMLRRPPWSRLAAPAGPSSLLRDAVARLAPDREEAALRKALHSYAEAELVRGDLNGGIALYVPPKATTDPTRKNVVDLFDHVSAFLGRALPGAAAGASKALLIAGEPGSSKSTFLAFLHRRTCEQWRRTHGRMPRGEGRLPATCLLRLSRLGRVAAASGLRAAVARAMHVAESDLQKIRKSRGLVLLLDAYDELECRDGPPPDLWPDNELADWASAVVVTCRSALLAVRDDYAELFAPRGPRGAPPALDQVENFFKQFVALYGPGAPAEMREKGCDWTAEEYLSQIRRIPGTLSLTENPFTLSMVARTLPKIVQARGNTKGGNGAAGSLLTIRELYNAFVEGWFERQWDRVKNKGNRPGVDIRSWKRKDFEQYGRSFCKDLAAAMFAASVSEVSCPVRRPDGVVRKQRFAATAGTKENEADGGPLQACIDLLQSENSPLEVFIRENCPLSAPEMAATEGQSSEGESDADAPRVIHVRFIRKTLLEYFVAEEMFERAIARNALATGSLRRQRRASLWSAAGSGLIHKFLLTGEPKILEFLADCCNSDSSYRSMLLGLLDQSRDRQAKKEDLVASANAMTILNRAGYSFAGSCLRGVRVPGADLQRLEAAGADLCDADLTGCGLHDANFGGADLRGAKLDGCAVVATAAVPLPRNMRSAFVLPTPDGRRVLFLEMGRMSEHILWDLQANKLIETFRFPFIDTQFSPLAVSKDGSRVMYSHWGDPAGGDKLKVLDIGGDGIRIVTELSVDWHDNGYGESRRSLCFAQVSV